MMSQKRFELGLFGLLAGLLIALPATAAEPNVTSYTCSPIFTTQAVEPNILLVVDVGAEMEQLDWHDDYDADEDFTPAGATDLLDTAAVTSGTLTLSNIVTPGDFVNNKAIEIGGATVATTNGGLLGAQLNFTDLVGEIKVGNDIQVCSGGAPCGTAKVAAITFNAPAPAPTGFYNANGYGVIKSANQYYLVKVNPDLTLDVAANGRKALTTNLANRTGLWLINGRLIHLPAEPETNHDDDGDGVIENAEHVRYTKNYLNWIFFSPESEADSYLALSAVDNGTDLPKKTRLAFAKLGMKAIADVIKRRALFGIRSFTGQGPGGVQVGNVQPLGFVYDVGGNLDPNFSNAVNGLSNVTHSPLAGALAEAGGYYASSASGKLKGECQQSFVILITPGISSKEKTYAGSVPGNSPFLDYDGDEKDGAQTLTISGVNYTIPTNIEGTTHLDDVAHYLYDTGVNKEMVNGSTANGYQISTYTIGFMASPASNRFLINTSNNGNGLQNLHDETNPNYGKYHYSADDPEDLSAKLLAVVNDILERAGSGTAVSVLATSGDGEGNLVQAFFRPVVPSGTGEVHWLGYLQALWVDAMGNLREDTVQDHRLDIGQDKIVSYFLDTDSGDTKVKLWNVTAAAPYPDTGNVPHSEIKELTAMTPIWEAGKRLQDRVAADRTIFTFIDINNDGVVNDAGSDPFDGNGEVITFATANADDLSPYLGVKHNATWSYLGADQATRVDNLIRFVGGEEINGLRSRLLDNKVWKLGDIVHSTPVTVAAPPDNYHLIYSDSSYNTFYQEFKDREIVVYVGANDGMMHAFTSWKYNPGTGEYTNPFLASPIQIGDELWAYIPQAVLPHLKWLPKTDYPHVYYVDLQPKIFDAKILPDETHYHDNDAEANWGTFMLVGLNHGGKAISVTDDFDYNGGTGDTTRDFRSSYALIDITEPRAPKLIWERSYDNLQLTASQPAVVKVENNWFAVFGSGPEDCDGNSSQRGYVYIVNLATGEPYGADTDGNSSWPDAEWLFQTPEANAFMGSPVSFDKDLDFSVDAVYLGGAYLDGTWKGKLYKITIPWQDGAGTYDGDNAAPLAANHTEHPLDSPFGNMIGARPWQFHTLLNATRPITAPPSLSMDAYDNLWIYFGTGRYLSNADKANIEEQYLFGIKDPFYNSQRDSASLINPSNTDYYHNYTNSLTLGIGNLFDADPYVVGTLAQVADDPDGSGLARITDWTTLLAAVRNTENQTEHPDFFDGWQRSLEASGERIVTKPAVLGGMIFVPSFVPSSAICGYGGDSFLYGLYYETGTAYFKPVFVPGIDSFDFNSDGQNEDTSKDKISLGYGKASTMGIHVGQESGATGLIQKSTGEVSSQTINPALNIRSGLRCWEEQ